MIATEITITAIIILLLVAEIVLFSATSGYCDCGYHETDIKILGDLMPVLVLLVAPGACRRQLQQRLSCWGFGVEFEQCRVERELEHRGC